ncbi:hypothetical protein F4819DRAFT_476073 [Hypoxylon fuscum]|nr:hypothetical protein F4819DRAFT_476073 [Hypoxylon fuscum]
MGNNLSQEEKEGGSGDSDGANAASVDGASAGTEVKRNPFPIADPLPGLQFQSQTNEHSSPPSSQPQSQSPNIIFSSQVPPSTNQRLPPNFSQFPRRNRETVFSPSPPTPQPLAHFSLAALPMEIAQLEIPESPEPEPEPQISAPAPEHESPDSSRKTKKKRRRGRKNNRVSLSSQLRSSIDYSDAPPPPPTMPNNGEEVPSSEVNASQNNWVSVNGSQNRTQNGTSTSQKETSKEEKKRKKKDRKKKTAQQPESPELGNGELASDPAETIEATEAHHHLLSDLPQTNGTAIASTPTNPASRKKRKNSEPKSQSKRKKHKRSHDEHVTPVPVPSFSSLAERLYSTLKKKKKEAEESDQDVVMTDDVEAQPSNQSDQAPPSPESDTSIPNTRVVGRDVHANAESDDNSQLHSKDHRNGLGANSGADDSSPDDAQSQDAIINEESGKEAEGGDDQNSDEEKGDEDQSVHSSDSAAEAASGSASATNDEYKPPFDDTELPDSSGEEHTNDAVAHPTPVPTVTPKQSSTGKRQRQVKPAYYDRPPGGANNGVNGHSSPTVAGPSKSTKQKQPKISTILKGNAVDSPEPKNSSSKLRGPPKKQQSHEVVTGPFSEFELRNITQAVERWREDHNLTQAQVNDLIQGNPREVKSNDFWSRIVATCPNRRRQKVINQCRRKFHNFVARGAWTPEQHEELTTLFERYGNKYAIIGKEINRHPEDVRDRVRNYVVCGDNRRVDPWDQEEEDNLERIVDTALQTIRVQKANGGLSESEPDDKLIDWQLVSEQMRRTRSRLQCMQKWKLIIRQKQAGAGSIDGGEVLPVDQIIEKARDEADAMTYRERYNIVKAIRSHKVNVDSRIPWAKMRSKQLGDQWTRPTIMLAWYRLKLSVPDWKIMTVPEITKQLLKTHHETNKLDYPSGDDYDLDAEYDDLENKINKILKFQHQHTPKTPRTVVKTDDDEEVIEDSEGNENKGNRGEENGDLVGEEDEISDSDTEVKMVNGKGKGKAGVVEPDNESSEGDGSTGDQSSDDDTPMEDAADRDSSGSVDLSHSRDDGSTHRESSADAPSISDTKPQKTRRRPKRYSSSSRTKKAEKSKGLTPSKRKATKTVIEESSQDEANSDDDGEVSSDTNASDASSIPARL